MKTNFMLLNIKLITALLLLSAFITSCTKADLTANMEETIYVRNQGADIPAFIRGNGTSKVFILFIHGGPGGSGLVNRIGTFSEMLEAKYAVVYSDQRAQGNSHGHLNKSEVTIDLMVEDTYVLIKALKQRYGQDIKVFLMGHSWGGALGTSFLLKNNYQSEVKGWIEVDGAHDMPLLNSEIVKMVNTIGEEEIAAGKNASSWSDIISSSNSIDLANLTVNGALKLNGYAGKAEKLITTLAPLTSPSVIKIILSDPNNVFAGSANAMQLSSTNIYNEFIKLSLTSQLSKITVPTLLLWGKYDFTVPPVVGEEALKAIGSTNKKLIIYEKSGHSGFAQEGEKFATDVISFIELYK